MLENKFENRIQHEMDDFRIRPSDAVWEKVEEELRKKKKRRVVFYLFLLAGLGLLGFSGWLIYDYSPSTIQTPAVSSSHITDTSSNNTVSKLPAEKPSINSRALENKEHETSNQKIKDVQPETRQNNNQNIVTRQYAANQKKSIINNKISGREPSTEQENKSYTINNREPAQTKKKPLPENDKLLNKEASLDGSRESKKNVSDSDVAVIGADVEEQATPLNPNIQNNLNSDSAETIKLNTASSAAKKIKVKQVPKINWGLDLSVGVSAYRDNVFSINNGQKSMDRLFSSPVNSGVNQAIFYTPSSIKPGFAFRAGIAADMNLSGRSSISSGIRYAYNSNKIRVGTYSYTPTAVSGSSSSFASSINNFYRGVQHKAYTNQFHFIQVPFQYQLQLTKGIHVPIIWTAGLTPGYLLSTNGLVYDTVANGIYFQNKKAFNKFQLDLHSGLLFVFGNKGMAKWSVGPEVSLGLNKITKTDYMKKQYLLYSGITGRMIFPKKKK